MKKFLALALSLVLLLVMAAPAMAAGGEDAVSPDALCNSGNHSLYVADETNFTWKYVDNNTHNYTKDVLYRCSRCKYSEVDTIVESSGPHNGSIVGGHCTGSTLTIYRNCKACGSEYAQSGPCPDAPHSGDCQRVPPT